MQGGGRGGRRDWREQPKAKLQSPEAKGLSPAATSVLQWRGMPCLHIRAGFLAWASLWSLPLLFEASLCLRKLVTRVRD